MKLRIRNIGVVKQIEIDFSKKLTLFCGSNSTGKTYVSYILHSFLNYGMPNENVYKVTPQIRQINKDGKFVINKDSITTWLGEACDNIKNNLCTIFGISDDTQKKLFDDVEIEAVFDDDDYQQVIDKAFNLSTDAMDFKAVKHSGDEFVEVEYVGELPRVATFLSAVVRILIFGHIGGVRMLTVERNSIYTFKTELSLSRNELVDRIQQNVNSSEINLLDMLSTSSRRYPYAVRSSLRIANDLENVQKKIGPYADIATMIEKDLLNGEVSMTKNGDVEFHASSMAARKRLPFHLSSSIVKTMASLVIYLRHLAQQEDTLIIDEPEMNFHPDVQVLLARIFAIMINRRLRLIISTHSDYIVREINNLIMINALRKNKKTIDVIPEGYTESMEIAPNDVQALSFNHKKKIVVVEPLSVTDTGFSVETIDNTIRQQNRVAQLMYDALLEE